MYSKRTLTSELTRPCSSIQFGPTPSARQRFNVAAERPRISAALCVLTSCGMAGFFIATGWDIIHSLLTETPELLTDCLALAFSRRVPVRLRCNTVILSGVVTHG